MRPIRPDRPEALHDVASTRRLETACLASLPAHALMLRAGKAVARLAQALMPHANCIWVACGPGNNGGDGLQAARHLHEWAQNRGGLPQVVVTHWRRSGTRSNEWPEPDHQAADASHALEQALAAGVVFSEAPPPNFDLAIDAVFGIGQRRPPPPGMQAWLDLLQETPKTVLCIDVPSQLDADTGALTQSPAGPPRPAAGPRHTLALLTLKPGLFTAHGRDQAGRVWFDDLGATGLDPDSLSAEAGQVTPTAWLAGRSVGHTGSTQRSHASHKGSLGDVAVLGGQDITFNGAGMTGAAVLAARAALQAGAGRVFLGLLEQPCGHENGHINAPLKWDPLYPELMLRQLTLMLEPAFLKTTTLVCGCGGGKAVAAVLAQLLQNAPRLVLDADALNTIAASPVLQQALQERHRRGWTTVLTPHPLEAARLLGCDTASVMNNRLQAAQNLSKHFQAVCVLKGSGTVICAPDERPLINPTGGPALATAGTGDVLAGMIGSALARADIDADLTLARVAQAVYQHGWLADTWDAGVESLRAGLLAARVKPLD